MPKFYTKFAPPPCDGIDFTDSPSLAKQEFEAECNINNILAKFKVTGVLVDPSVRSLRQPMFLDCTQVPDLETYHNRLNACKQAFEDLPKEIQEAFGYDARIAMQWLSNASDRQVVQLFDQLVPKPVAPSLAGAGGASPQNKPIRPLVDDGAKPNADLAPSSHLSNDSPSATPTE